MPITRVVNRNDMPLECCSKCMFTNNVITPCKVPFCSKGIYFIWVK